MVYLVKDCEIEANIRVFSSMKKAKKFALEQYKKCYARSDNKEDWDSYDLVDYFFEEHSGIEDFVTVIKMEIDDTTDFIL